MQKFPVSVNHVKLKCVGSQPFCLVTQVAISLLIFFLLSFLCFFLFLLGVSWFSCCCCCAEIESLLVLSFRCVQLSRWWRRRRWSRGPRWKRWWSWRSRWWWTAWQRRVCTIALTFWSTFFYTHMRMSTHTHARTRTHPHIHTCSHSSRLVSQTCLNCFCWQ